MFKIFKRKQLILTIIIIITSYPSKTVIISINIIITVNKRVRINYIFKIKTIVTIIIIWIIIEISIIIKINFQTVSIIVIIKTFFVLT